MTATELYIFSRTLNGVREFYTGSYSFVEDYHNPDKWNECYDECLPCMMISRMHEEIAMLEFVYDETVFEFHQLIFTKKETTDETGTTVGIDDDENEVMADPIRPDSD